MSDKPIIYRFKDKLFTLKKDNWQFNILLNTMFLEKMIDLRTSNYEFSFCIKDKFLELEYDFENFKLVFIDSFLDEYILPKSDLCQDVFSHLKCDEKDFICIGEYIRKNSNSAYLYGTQLSCEFKSNTTSSIDRTVFYINTLNIKSIDNFIMRYRTSYADKDYFIYDIERTGRLPLYIVIEYIYLSLIITAILSSNDSFSGFRNIFDRHNLITTNKTTNHIGRIRDEFFELKKKYKYINLLSGREKYFPLYEKLQYYDPHGFNNSNGYISYQSNIGVDGRDVKNPKRISRLFFSGELIYIYMYLLSKSDSYTFNYLFKGAF